MRPFRFRPQAALDLRIKQEEHALGALAVAQTAFATATVRTTAAIDNAVAAADAFASAQREGMDGSHIAWHRSWIVKQRLEVDARRREVAVSAAGVEGATASVRTAHQRRRTLERLRERAGKKYQHDVLHEATKEMTLLAGLRYLTRTADDGGTDK
jgi:flagellar export protein FliJ